MDHSTPPPQQPSHQLHPTPSSENRHSPTIPYYSHTWPDSTNSRTNQNTIPVLYAHANCADVCPIPSTSNKKNNNSDKNDKKKCEPLLTTDRLAILSSFLSLLSSAASFIGVISVSQAITKDEEEGVSSPFIEDTAFLEQLAFIDLGRNSNTVSDYTNPDDLVSQIQQLRQQFQQK